MTEVVLREALPRRRADEWALALASQGLHPTVGADGRGFSLFVPETELEHSEAVLAAYESENRPTGAISRVAPADAAPLRNASFVSAALLVFFVVTGPRDSAIAWFERGSADAARIFAGEPWRVITALTLHADGPHVAGNALFGTLFWGAVSRSLGPGMALAWVIAAGALGNLVNAWVRSSAHDSVGASTAVFGAVGILAGLGLTRRLRIGERGRRVLVPIAAGLGLLAMLGTTGERVDLWAHIFGLAAGVPLGVVAGRVVALRPGAAWQWSAGLLGVAAVVASWNLALR